MTSDYRSIILERLKARDKYCEQFARVFNSYVALSESLDHLLAKGGKSAGRRRVSPTDDGSAEKLAVLRSELANLYKKKAINDQALIEANAKLAKLDNVLMAVEKKRNEAQKELESIRAVIVDSERKIGELREENLSLKVIFDSALESYRSVNADYLRVDQERVALIDQIKRMKEYQITMMNEQNEVIEKKRLEKISNDLADAVKTHQPVTARISKLAGELLLPSASSSMDAADENAPMDHMGDMIPERCRIRLEVNEMGEVNDCIFHPNGRFFFTGGNDKIVKMFEISGETTAKKGVFQGANQGVTRIALDAESGLLAASSNDKTVRVWSVADRRLRVTFAGHSDKVVAARFVSGGQMIASGSNDRNVKLFDIGSNRCAHTYFPASMVLDVATNDRYGAPIISSHYDKSVRFWDLRVSTPANCLKFSGKVASLFADDQQLLCSCRDETLSLIDLRNNGTIHTYSAEQYRTSSDYCKSIISPGGTYIASGSADGHIFVWNTLSTRLEKVLYKNAHENAPILSLAWHPRGHIIISGDKRKTLCLWA